MSSSPRLRSLSLPPHPATGCIGNLQSRCSKLLSLKIKVNAITTRSYFLSGRGVTPGTVFFGFMKNHLAGNVVSSCLWAERGSPGIGHVSGEGTFR